MMNLTFIFKSYLFDEKKKEASFYYEFNNGLSFCEKIIFSQVSEKYNEKVFERALFLAFIVIGTSYYKTFPTKNVRFEAGELDAWQASFANTAYQEGLSQFAFENGLRRNDLAHFLPSSTIVKLPFSFAKGGVIALQSGGKDSLLTAVLLDKKKQPFTPWYLSSSHQYPGLLDEFERPLALAERLIDHQALEKAESQGGINGHVPVTYIVLSIATLEAILNNLNTVVVSIGHEGEESHAAVGDLSVKHQWSKTWEAEKLFSEYIHRYVSPDISVGSPLRHFSELYIAELFSKYAWHKFGKVFSSCNRANYAQGQNNTNLKWCSDCPKCANSYLLFAPFIHPYELQNIFSGEDLFNKKSLEKDFQGLLGINDEMKPFECVGEIDELRLAYHMAQENWENISPLPFAVSKSSFDYKATYAMQNWAKKLLI